MGTDCGTSARTAAVASAGGLAQKRALDSPERREAVWAYPIAKTHQRLSGAVCGALGTKAWLRHRRPHRYRTGQAGDRELRATCRRA
jgi:hypothetical protein